MKNKQMGRGSKAMGVILRAASAALCLGLASLAAQAQTRTVSFTYTTFGELDTETLEPTGDANTVKFKTQYIRDDADGATAVGVITKRRIIYHDPQTNLDVTRDVETLTYDPRKRYVSTITDAKGHVETRNHDEANGNLLTLVGPNGLPTTWRYDAWGRKTQETHADRTATTWAYRRCVDTCLNSAANVTVTQNWITDGIALVNGVDGGSTLLSQTAVPGEAFSDALGRAVFARTWGFDGTAIHGERLYDSNGRLLQVARERFVGTAPVWSTYAYDPIGRVQTVRSPNAAGTGDDITSIVYNGLVTVTTNVKGQVRTDLRNALGKLKATTDDYGFTTSYRYDGFGDLLQTADPQGNRIVVTYDTLGRKTQLQDPDLGTWTYQVNPLGQTWRQTDAKNQTTTYTFDELGRITQRLEPDLDSHWVYDTANTGIGKLAEAYTWIAGTGTKSYQQLYAYDTLGRSQSVTTRLDWDYVLESGYDGFGRRVSSTHRRNAIGGTAGPYNTLTSVYNSWGYASQLTLDSGSGTSTLWTAQVLDAEGRLRQAQLGNGLYTQRSYNGNTGRLESITSGPALGSNSVQNDQYTYDGLGNLYSRTQLISTGGTQLSETFDYDRLNRLTASTVGGQAGKTFAYDSIGNITSKAGVSYSYLAAGNARAHAVSSIAGTMAGVTNPTFTYDGNGNLVDGLNRHYTWSSGNQPLTIDRLSGGVAVERTEFVFDSEHQRIKQVVSPIAGGAPGVPYRSIYYGAGMEKEVDASANTTTIRTYLPAGLGYIEERFSGTAVVSSSSGTRNVRYMLLDHLGSAIAMVDQGQVVLQRMSYDSWGKRRNADGTDDALTNLGSIANTNDHTGYTGEEQLDQLGLVHLNGRVYDPIIGRMTSADPTVPEILNPQALNRYSYVLNNALAFVDPTGFASEDYEEGVTWHTESGFTTDGGRRSMANAPSFGCEPGVPCIPIDGGHWANDVCTSQACVAAALASFARAFGEDGLRWWQTNAMPKLAKAGVVLRPMMVRTGVRAGVTLAAGLGPEDPLADVAALVVVAGSLVYECVAHCGEIASILGQDTGQDAGQGAGPNNMLKSDSRKLAANITKATGQTRQKNDHAHHIVAVNDPRAQPARDVLKSVGMDINDAFNGVMLAGSDHASIHTNVYYAQVNALLTGASSYSDVAVRLTAIGAAIASGTFPH